MAENQGSKLKNIFDQARRLAPVDRAELLERLFGTFETKNQSEIDAAWAAEAEDRLASYKSGDLEAEPAAQVLKQINSAKDS